MKKHIYLFAVLVALLLASCKNEDIDISREVVFEVNPYEVIRGFVPYEMEAGDLAELSYGEKLRVRLLVYDANGNLETSAEKDLQDYNSTMNASFTLPDGSYTIVATTSVVNSEGSDKYWSFNNMDRLLDFQISDEGWVGSDDKILGIGHKKIIVESGNVSFDVPMEPAGALIESRVTDFSGWSNLISGYYLMTKRTSTSCSFNADGSFNTYFEERTDYSYIQDIIPQTSGYGIYSYTFALPLGRCDFRWELIWQDGDCSELDNMPLEIKKGKMYLFDLNMNELVYYYGEMGSKSVPQDGNEKMLTKSERPDSSKIRIEN